MDSMENLPATLVEHVISHVTKLYPVVPFDNEPTRPFLIHEVERFIQSAFINWAGGPGYPFGVDYATNQQVVENNYPELVLSVVHLLEQWRDVDPEEVKHMTSHEHFVRGLYFPFRVFVKKEPHNLKKVREKRWRPILSESLVVSIAYGVLYQDMIQVEIAQCDTLPSKPGMGLDQSGLAAIWKYVQNMATSTDVISDDVRRWDWSVRSFLNMMVTEIHARQRACKGTLWHRMMLNADWCQQNALIVTSGGQVLELLIPGGIKSGGRLTACGNSKKRKTLQVIVSMLNTGTFGASACMGDDCVETYCGDLQKHLSTYKALGFDITDPLPAKIGQPFDFCSHYFTTEFAAEPTQWARTFYRLLSKQKTVEDYESWQREMRNLSGVVGPTTLEHLEEVLVWAQWHSTLGQAQIKLLTDGIQSF